MADLTIFAFESAAVRTLDLNGEPWFVATDIAKILGYKLTTDMCKMLDEDEAGMHNLHVRSENGVEQMREVTIINESGLYACILKSRRPEAKAFRKWVTGEVLPAIRKTGGYTAAVPPAPTFAPMNHGADVLVAADRTFRSVLRTCRAVGLRLPQAISRANEATKKRTGVDVLAEIDATEMVAAMAHRRAAQEEPLEDPLRPMVEEWLAAHPEVDQIHSATLIKAILANVSERQMRSAQMRIGEIFRALGWRKIKLSTGRRENLWVRPREDDLP